MTTHDGWTPEGVRLQIETQGGLCYLCCDPLPDDRYLLATDHDHRCCGPKRSCAYCRRGLTCHGCNVLIGHAQDDPARLRRIADNLEAAIADVTQRIAGRPVRVEREAVKRRAARPSPRGTLFDVCRIFGDDGQLQWQVIAERLAAQVPRRYEGITPEAISAQCRALGVPSIDVRFPPGRRGSNKKGCRKSDVLKTAAQRKPPLAA